MMNNVIKALKDNLQKKNDVLDKIWALCDRQKQMLSDSDMLLEEFDRSMDEKESLVNELETLDAEFQGIYGELQELASKKDKQISEYANEIQVAVKRIMEKSTGISQLEKDNKEKLDSYFRDEKKGIGEGRRASKGAYDYYKNMSRTAVIPPQFMDKKK